MGSVVVGVFTAGFASSVEWVLSRGLRRPVGALSTYGTGYGVLLSFLDLLLDSLLAFICIFLIAFSLSVCLVLWFCGATRAWTFIYLFVALIKINFTAWIMWQHKAFHVSIISLLI